MWIDCLSKASGKHLSKHLSCICFSIFFLFFLEIIRNFLKMRWNDEKSIQMWMSVAADIELQFELIACVITHTEKYTPIVFTLEIWLDLRHRYKFIEKCHCLCLIRTLFVCSLHYGFSSGMEKNGEFVVLIVVVSSRSLCDCSRKYNALTNTHISSERKHSFIVCHLDKYEQIECVCLASTK